MKTDISWHGGSQLCTALAYLVAALPLWVESGMTNGFFSALLAGLWMASAVTASAATFTAQVIDSQGKPLADAVVTLQGPAGTAPVALQAAMDQREQEFAPHVLAVHSGTQVKFPNSDNIRHQVYSFSPAKRFELRLYEGTPSAPLLFDKPGVVVLGCNIHDWMVGYIYVTDEPWFGVTDSNGLLKLDQLPAGHYAATLWHPKIEDMQPVSGDEFDVPATGLVQHFKLNVEVSPDDKPAKPAPGGFGEAFHKAAHE
ncbi:Protein containing plastocyanin/azurin family domain [Pseudomonas coronafaciens pv. porri]|nr:Protein containing plastocyanin/azurin family domain [Pseudomonas coronafaciens pv. porri]RMM86215.1 Protein containing plastocyanin/azurin family domain [Pseudomonas coronafaciens pv. striafaciens]RMW05250.1 Protein containing plastocyanin/azurin family domain [Pseudomonas coronafaciens pv. porri]